jgi:hypothetical protein
MRCDGALGAAGFDLDFGIYPQRQGSDPADVCCLFGSHVLAPNRVTLRLNVPEKSGAIGPQPLKINQNRMQPECSRRGWLGRPWQRKPISMLDHSRRALTLSEDKPIRAWQRMLSGRRLDLLNPDPADIEIGDIAHGLARVARWNGQTRGDHAMSVAQHAVLVEAIADGMEPAAVNTSGLPAAGLAWDDRCRLAALLHDAAEYVIGDLISPFKTAIGLDYKAFELRLMGAVHVRFGLPAELPPAIANHIKQADRIAAYYEATCLAGFAVAEAEIYFGRPSGIPAALTAQLEALRPIPAEHAQSAFLARFDALDRSA